LRCIRGALHAQIGSGLDEGSRRAARSAQTVAHRNAEATSEQMADGIVPSAVLRAVTIPPPLRLVRQSIHMQAKAGAGAR
jgi:hypothetical protein